MRRGRHRKHPAGSPGEDGKSLEEMEAELAGSPEDRARRGRWRLVVAVVIFTTVVLPKLVGPESYTGPAPALTRPDTAHGRTTAEGPSPSGSREPPGTAPSSKSPSATGPGPDAAENAFRSVRTGQCLSVHRDGDGHGWSAASPSESVRVDCDAADAHLRVSSVKEDSADCPTGEDESRWSPPGSLSGSSLCLTRQFRQDDCLFAGPEGAGTPGKGVRADLMSAPDCGTRKIPEPYDRVLTVTGILPGGARSASQGLCAREPHDGTRYWNWRVGDEGTVICAAEEDEDVEGENEGGAD